MTPKYSSGALRLLSCLRFAAHVSRARVFGGVEGNNFKALHRCLFTEGPAAEIRIPRSRSAAFMDERPYGGNDSCPEKNQTTTHYSRLRQLAFALAEVTVVRENVIAGRRLRISIIHADAYEREFTKNKACNIVT
jgi:hypothetical protein